MNQPTPAIVTQNAVRRLPRLALLLFCVAYVLPGFLGRDPWRTADMMAFGYMFELASGRAAWLAPALLGQPPEFDALLPYWLGAWAIQLAPTWIAADLAARLPFIALLVLTLLCTWYGVYYLARSPRAQPVAFAFGGEAQPTDYARAMADGGLLALIACLGLAQLTHETTPALAQLGFTGLSFYGLAALPYRKLAPIVALFAGAGGLALSGAPTLAVLFTVGGMAVTVLDRPADAHHDIALSPWPWVALALLAAGLAAALGWGLDLWRWRVFEGGRDARSVAALIDWFTLIFFTGCALVMWVVWLSLHTGIPAKPAANVARLAPGFEPSFSLLAFLAALVATAAWAWLVRWRAGRHRAAIWKSLVLPAGGAALCWLLLMTLWLPVLDFARSYVPVVRNLQQQMDPPGCVEVFGLDRAQLAALRFHGNFDVRAAGTSGTCPWLVVSPELQASVPIAFGNVQWRLVSGIRRPTDRDVQLLLYQKTRPDGSENMRLQGAGTR